MTKKASINNDSSGIVSSTQSNID